MHAYVGTGALDVGAPPRRVAKTIAHRILDPQRGEFEALERALLGGDVHPQGTLDAKEPRPLDRTRRVVDALLVAIAEIGDFPQHARSDARPKVGCVADFPAAAERHPAGDSGSLRSFQRDEFAKQQILEPARRAGEERLRTA